MVALVNDRVWIDSRKPARLTGKGISRYGYLGSEASSSQGRIRHDRSNRRRIRSKNVGECEGVDSQPSYKVRCHEVLAVVLAIH